MSAPLLSVEDLQVQFPIRSGVLRRQVGSVSAVDRVTFALSRGETVGLVGESGCGKTTTARAVMRLVEPTAGRIFLLGKDITHLSKRELRPLRGDMQIVFQNPFGSLNGRMTVHQIIAEPLKTHGAYGRDGKERVLALMERVGLNEEHWNRYPSEFSGGQRQRIGIARALALAPSVLVLDEPVSALDVSIQAQVLSFLAELQTQTAMAYLFIAHDLAVVHHIADRIFVMYLGRIVESGRRDDLYVNPLHPYTQGLLSAIPKAEPVGRASRGRIALEGDPPSPSNPPSGCRFRTRCWKAQSVCGELEPPLIESKDGHSVACHFPETLQAIEPPRVRRLP